MKYNRRLFLKLATPFLLSIFTFKNLSAKIRSGRKNHFFLDESNLFSNDDIFVLGLLHSTNIKKSASTIRYLRSINNYRTELTYRSTDKYKVQFSKDLIDYFFYEQTLKFSARVITGKIYSGREDYYSKKESSYHLHYKQIIIDSFVQNNSVIHLENRSLYKTNNKLKQFLNKRYNVPFKNIQHPKSDLSQLSDLLTGCIIGDTHSLTNSSKIEILEYLKNKLEIKHFSELYNLESNGKFEIVQTQI
jgi:hypothetical protein